MSGDTRCTERVPSRLCGGLKGDARPLCERTDKHKRHKATRYLRGVGKTSWEWKSPDAAVMAPTFIEPKPPKTKTWAPKESHGRCCKGFTFHMCREYRGLLRL